MRFEKMHGLGNDFLVVDDREGASVAWSVVARRLCARRTGAGADGLLLVQGSAVADLRMRLFNADGSEAEMCGNGVRCVAAYVRERSIAGDRVTWETGAGPVVTELRGDGMVSVDMGVPRLAPADIPVDLGEEPVLDAPLRVDGEEVRVTCVGMGNPHCVVIVDDTESYPVHRLGPLLERHPAFPRRTNVEFVQVLSRNAVRQRTFERGVGETDACGTGACAAAVAVQLLGACDAPVEVRLRGGSLHIAWSPGGSVTMTGPATHVYSADVDLVAEELVLERGRVA